MTTVNPPEVQPDNLSVSAIFVDIDDTLNTTDHRFERSLRTVHQSLGSKTEIPLWALKRKALPGPRMSGGVEFETASSPIRPEVLEFLRARRAEGCRIVLASGSPDLRAESIADKTGIFDDILSSQGEVNLNGFDKLAAINDYCRLEGVDRWAYIGDGTSDSCIWETADATYSTGKLGRTGAEFDEPAHGQSIVAPAKSTMWAALRVMRPHQWAKNALIFVPLAVGHAYTDPASILAAVLAFFCFCLAASAIYIVNDLLDIEADRRHPIKKNRPFAAGTLPVFCGPPLAMCLLLAALTVSIMLPTEFLVLMLVYLGMTTVYSFWLKRQVMLDVVVLAMLYTLRVIAGGAAVSLPISEWLMAYSLFIFMSLALTKRYAELRRLSDQLSTRAAGRGYRVSDISVLKSMGTACGYLSVLVMALYINNPDTRLMYDQPQALWLICPLLLYWISRVWLLACRGEMSEDPVVFALKDKASLGVGVMAVIILVAGRVGW